MNESLILGDESLILVDESLILGDESLILADESLILINKVARDWDYNEERSHTDRKIHHLQPLSKEKQSRLEKKRETLQTEWDIRNAKVAQLRKDLAIQAGRTNKFQLEQQLQEEEAELSKLDNQLDLIEAQIIKSQVQLSPPSNIQPRQPQSNNGEASPFITGSPITEPRYFFGRDKELKRLFNLLKRHP